MSAPVRVLKAVGLLPSADTRLRVQVLAASSGLHQSSSQGDPVSAYHHFPTLQNRNRKYATSVSCRLVCPLLRPGIVPVVAIRALGQRIHQVCSNARGKRRSHFWI